MCERLNLQMSEHVIDINADRSIYFLITDSDVIYTTKHVKKGFEFTMFMRIKENITTM